MPALDYQTHQTYVCPVFGQVNEVLVFLHVQYVVVIEEIREERLAYQSAELRTAE